MIQNQTPRDTELIDSLRQAVRESARGIVRVRCRDSRAAELFASGREGGEFFAYLDQKSEDLITVTERVYGPDDFREFLTMKVAASGR